MNKDMKPIRSLQWNNDNEINFENLFLRVNELIDRVNELSTKNCDPINEKEIKREFREKFGSENDAGDYPYKAIMTFFLQKLHQATAQTKKEAEKNKIGLLFGCNIYTDTKDEKVLKEIEEWFTNRKEGEERVIKNMREKMFNWSGTGHAMIDDYEKSLSTIKEANNIKDKQV